jgi:hypothetical protein
VHLLFREQTVMTVRASYRVTAARHYLEAGLNKMSLRKLEALLSASGMSVDYIRFHGVKGQDWVSGIPLLRELLVNQVTCELTRVD